MHLFKDALWSRLLTLLLLGFSINSFALDQEQDDLHFWEKWNQGIAELVQRELATPDPWEPWNRKVHSFNVVVDRYTLTPLAKAYQWVAPDIVEKGVSNVFSNLLDIRTVINDLLQLKLKQTASDTGRLLLNTTVGLVGVFDVATPIGLEKHNEDFGQTLGYWGVGAGPYLVAPLLGSYTLRDGFGTIVDIQVSILGDIDHIPTRNQLYLTRTIDTRARLFAAEKLLAGDKYAFIRDAYLQRREYLVKDGAIEDTFGEEDFTNDWDDE